MEKPRSRLLDNGDPLQRQLQGVLAQEKLLLDDYPIMSYGQTNKGGKHGNRF